MNYWIAKYQCNYMINHICFMPCMMDDTEIMSTPPTLRHTLYNWYCYNSELIKVTNCANIMFPYSVRTE